MACSFKNPLPELNEYGKIKEELTKGRGPVAVSGCVDSQKVHLMSGLGEISPFNLVITYSDARAKEIYEDYRSFSREVWLYPAKDLLFYSADLQGNLLTSERLSVIRQLFEKKSGTVVTTIDGCMDYLMPPDKLKESVLDIEEGQEIDIEDLKKKLVLMGYERMAQVEQPGQFCIRGGIIDIYPLTQDNPFRIELWGDEVDSVRTFDTESQRSVDKVDSARIYPAAEIVLTEERLKAGTARIKKECRESMASLKKQMKGEEAARIKKDTDELLEGLNEGYTGRSLAAYIRYFYPDTVSFLDYFPEGTIYFLDEPVRIGEKADVTELEFRESMSNRLEKGFILPGQAEILSDTRYIFNRINSRRCIQISGLDQKEVRLVPKNRYHLTVQNGNSYHNGFEMLTGDLKRWKKDGYRVVLLSPSRTRAIRLAGDLREEYGLSAYFTEEEQAEVKPGEICVCCGSLRKGFEYPLIKFVVITEGDMFGTEKKKKKRKKSDHEGKKIRDFAELSVGDYVIHENHGLGVYRGIEKIEVERVVKDYIKLEYSDGGNLFVPVTQLDMIQKFADADARKPKLNKLGGTEWGKTKSRVKKAVQDIAQDLVELYAARQKKQGYCYGPDTVWQREFEELFPYEATDDQLDAIEAAKRDMESTKIMDRLVCGDVGYGKTEVAIRTAFKAVQEGKQVVYLVPTTILAQQHYNTFSQRMMEFPVRVDLMSRFRSPAQQKKTLEDLKKGLVDIVVGTHRLLSKDVVYKDLGLLIIDEEQRFGVAHKEKIKKMKDNVDVLTLTATPIPRTLHMSLIGIRDMSVLEEPPMDRVPIQTYVMEYNGEMVREAIQRELARDGQVYYVFNRVKNIEEITGQIAALVPDANVAFAHGQMPERQLEKIMFEFISGEIDVLVSTTIIETGLDISNVNTIIIHDADRFGLSQLYQLRGRVGRSNRTAYAFLMYKRDKILKEEAEKRLQAIREFTDLGSGVKIAMRDLEIRGAGNLLGAEQHGHMEAVGYDLYCKLLNNAVRLLKGETEEETFETTVDFDINAYIPLSYIRNEYQKLDVYKRIAGIETEEEYMDMQDELIDRFGEMPKPVENLLKVACIKAAAHEANVTEVTGNRQEIRLKMYEKAAVNTENIPLLIEKYKGELKFSAVKQPCFTYIDKKNKNKDVQSMLNTVKILLNEIKLLLEK